MAFRRRRRASKKNKSKRVVVKRAIVKAERQVFNQRVKRVVTSMAEKKIQVWQSTTFSALALRTGSASFLGNMQPLTPYSGYYSISQGSAVSEREGNAIRVTSAILRMNIIPNPYNVTTNPNPTPCMVRIWFLTYKPQSTVPPPSASVYGASATFLDNGATNSGLTGTFSDLQYPVNKDVFTVHGYRTFKVAPSIYEGTGAQPTYGNFGNNDFKLCQLFTVNVTKYFPKIIRWDDTVADPTSKNVSMLVQPIFCTGVAPGASVTPISYRFSLTLNYIDD